MTTKVIINDEIANNWQFSSVAKHCIQAHYQRDTILIPTLQLLRVSLIIGPGDADTYREIQAIRKSIKSLDRTLWGVKQRRNILLRNPPFHSRTNTIQPSI